VVSRLKIAKDKATARSQKAKRKAQKAKPERTAIIEEVRFWGLTFAFCDLRFAF